MNKSFQISVIEPLSKHRRSWAKDAVSEEKKSSEGEEDFIQRLSVEEIIPFPHSQFTVRNKSTHSYSLNGNY